MWIPALADLDRDALVRTVGHAALQRGRGYAEGRVLDLEWDGVVHELRGVVAGNGSIYTTTAVILPDGRGRLAVRHGHCSCPMQRNCKHVAAIALAAAGTPEDAASRPPPAAAVPAWLQTLRPALGSPGPQPTGDPMGLALRIHTPVGTTGPAWSAVADLGPRLVARIVRPGRSTSGRQWVAGEVSWSRLDSWYAKDHPPDHLRLLRQLRSLHDARTEAHTYGSRPTAIDLGDVGPALWQLLDEAAQLGMALIQDDDYDHAPVSRLPDVTVHLDVRGAADGWTLTPQVSSTGTPLPEGLVPVAVLGSPAHGLVLAAGEGDDGGETAPQVLHLARLDQPLAAAIAPLVLDGRPVAVPSTDVDRFVTEAWPALRHVVAITSSDAVFTPPEVQGPVLHLQVAFLDEHAAEVRAGWGYRLGERTAVLPLNRRPPPRLLDRFDAQGRFDAPGHFETQGRADPGGQAGESLRDSLAETALLDRLLDEAGDALAAAGLLGTRDRLAPQSLLHGMDTARLAAEALPMLTGHPDIDVEVSGTPADYQEVGDRLEIGVATDEVADRTDWFDLGITVTADGIEVPLAQLLEALSADQPHLLLDDGRYLSLQKPDLQALRRLLDEARALQDPASPGLRLSRYQADLWAELAALGVVTRQAAAWKQQVEGLLEDEPGRDIPVPATVQATLRPYQREGFSWLAFLWQHRLGGILADDMGLGKTVQALALICHARAAKPDDPPFLVLAPTSVVPGWVAEAARFAPHLRVVAVDATLRKSGQTMPAVVAGADVVVTSYTLARLDADDYTARPWGGVLLDEAQAVKNHRSKLYGCVRRLDAPTKIAITGTPMENHLMELWSLLSITAPGLFPDPRRFETAYARPIQRHHDVAMLAQLRRRIRPLLTRRTKEQVAADLPAKQEQVLEVDLHPAHRRAYDRQLQRERQRILGLLDDFDRNRIMVLRALTVLRQLSLHPDLVDGAVTVGAKGAGAKGVSAKVDVLVEHLAEVAEGGHRALVFSQFTRFLDLVTDRLDAEGIGHCRLDGSTRNRGAVIDGFKRGDAPVFLISLKAGGFGLNLTEADYVFLLDPWWNPATEAQAIDRAHRIGQIRNVMVYRLIARDTIEEKVLALARRKADLVRGVMADGDPFGGVLSAADIRGLLS
ncbi:DEAD/DEAH box helicase [soil metagenome]